MDAHQLEQVIRDADNLRLEGFADRALILIHDARMRVDTKSPAFGDGELVGYYDRLEVAA